MYQQLISESQSRINACKGYQAAHHEWVATLGDHGNNFTHKHWCGVVWPKHGAEIAASKEHAYATVMCVRC